MQLLAFFKTIARADARYMLLLTSIAGLANALLVVAVNGVARAVAGGAHPGLIGCLMFGAAFAVYYLGDRYALLRANTVVERELKAMRLQTVARLRQSEVRLVERTGHAALVKVLAQETNHLSVAFPIIVDSIQQLVLLCASMAYLAWLSPKALLVFVLFVVSGMAGYWGYSKKYRDSLAQASAKQTQMMERVTDLIDGGKELRLHAQKSASVFQDYRRLSDDTEALLVEAGSNLAGMILLASTVAYTMLGAMVFVLPKLFAGNEVVIFQLVPTLLFCIGPFTKIVTQSPMFVRAEMGLAAIGAIDRQLDLEQPITPAEASQAGPLLRDFQRIDYRGIRYRYEQQGGEQAFLSGPWDLHLQRGELIFLVGGNGSGKSTALRLMTGLYQAEAGVIEVDGQALERTSFAGLREQFAAIFGNFHLFDRLYGLEQVDAQEVEALIADMELTGKVRYEDGQFTDLQLSTGQRKRLALIAALLEDRPIYAFDEWSAEQDVHFREVFYQKILPRLRQQGKTVVAVTHDERYWHLADRVIRFDLGQVQWERRGSELPAEVA